MMDTTFEQTGENTARTQSTTGKIVKWSGLTVISLCLLAFFTLIKLPQAKITNLIQGHLSNALADYNILVPRLAGRPAVDL